MAVMFAPIIFSLGGMALRATTADIAKRLAAAGAKKIAEKTAKKVVNATKTNIDKAIKAAEKLKQPTINLKIKPSPKPVAKPKVDKTVNKTTTKPTSTTTKPTVKKPKKVTTTQKTTSSSKPTVNTTTTKPTTPKPKPKPKATNTKPKPSNTPRNITIVAGIGGAGYFLDKLVNKDKPVNVEKTTNRPKRESTPITSKGPPQRQLKKDDKLKNLRTTPKDEDAILSKIAAPKPKSNISKFGRAFKNARKQGRYSFNFNGNEITTRFKEETVAEHKKKFGKK